MKKNIFLYWVGKEFKLIKILRNLIYYHLEKKCKIHLINDKNINNYIKEIPNYFYNLCPAHQADYVRVNVICDKGGIWLDSDTLVLNDLNCLFNLLEQKDGFFIKENNTHICNGVFGSKANTPLMIEWKNTMNKILLNNKNISWTSIGSNLLETIKKNKPQYYDNYTIFEGLDNMYPVNWNNCVNEFIKKPYDNYKNIIKEYQPLILLVNSVYKELENKTKEEINNMPLNYFLNKSKNDKS